MNGRHKITTAFLNIVQSIELPNPPLSTSIIQRQSAGPKEAFVSTFVGVFPTTISFQIRNSHSNPERAPSTASKKDPSCSNGYDPNSDVILSNKRITNFVRAGDLDSAFREFHKMKVKSTASWNSLLSWYVKRPEKMSDACELFDKIPQPDSVSYNIMLACYLRNFGLHCAMQFFNSMPVKDIASWNTMISGFSQSGKMREAYELFKIMPDKNGVTWSAMISGYVESGDLEAAKELFGEASIKSVVVRTAMITGYMKFGKVELAEEVFREMSVKNIVTWNAMIAGYVENFNSEDGLKIFKAMIDLGMRPNPSSLSSVLLGCSNLCALQMGRQIHQLVSKTPLCTDITAGTSIISMYCKCGDLENARKLFEEMPKKDVITWNAMICCYAQHGSGKKALDLFDKMRGEQMRPDWITFVAVLLACTHAGLVDLGISYFRSMTTNYGVEVRLDHYTCVVDLLGRAGRLAEAVNVIKEMPFKPHSAIFGTLLGACRIHKNLKLAEFAATSLLHQDPTSATAYVQLANIYAAMNKWDQVAKVRRSMKENKIVKTPGYSWIEVKNVAHEFRSSDRQHPELTAIHKKLNELVGKMKLSGYAPVLEFALHDVEEEHKEKLLLWHSEKLAVAFGLLKLPGKAPIRVFKNLRICGDCHEAMKYISGIERREIIVRDTTRFHHFKNGVCSCDNYW